MPRWLLGALKRIRKRAAARRVAFTLRARRELAQLGMGLDEEDACELLARLASEDSAGRTPSDATGEWMYVFRPKLAGATLYVKVVLRSECIVVSFHEDGGGDEDQGA